MSDGKYWASCHHDSLPHSTWSVFRSFKDSLGLTQSVSVASFPKSCEAGRNAMAYAEWMNKKERDVDVPVVAVSPVMRFVSMVCGPEYSQSVGCQNGDWAVFSFTDQDYRKGDVFTMIANFGNHSTSASQAFNHAKYLNNREKP